MLQVTRNTFPQQSYFVDGVEKFTPHAEPGDIVRWETQKGRTLQHCLVRESDGKTLMSKTLYDKDTPLPPRTGIVFQNKAKGYYLEVKEV